MGQYEMEHSSSKMSSPDEIHVVALQEAGDDIYNRRGTNAVSFNPISTCSTRLTRTERERHAPVVFGPSSDVLVRVRPQEIAEKACEQGKPNQGSVESSEREFW